MICAFQNSGEGGERSPLGASHSPLEGWERGVESNHLRDLGRGIPIRIPRYLVGPPFVMFFYDQFLVFR